MKKSWLKIGFIVTTICTLLAVGIVVYLFNKPQRDIATEKPSYSVTASQIFNEFSTDEVQANNKYLSDKNGKIIEVSGLVSDIIAQADTILTISINDKNMTEGGIICSIDKSDIPKATRYKIGDKILLKGECNGYMDLTSEVSFSKCVIIEQDFYDQS